jgi:hypothetical protein
MEKFAIGLALGCLGGALLTANNYKMRMLVRKGQEEAQSKIDKMIDDRLRKMDDVDEDTDENQRAHSKKKSKD